MKKPTAGLPRLCAIALALGLTAGHAAHAQSSNAAKPKTCEALAKSSIAHTKITSAASVTAGAFVAPAPTSPGPPPADFSKLPAFCRVTGSIKPTADSDIRFELWLPADGQWNGKFLQTGNGGAAGAIVYGSLADPLSRGYAVTNTDTGHQGGGGDFAWAVGHPEKLVDFQYRAVHELTLAGKAITTARYGRVPAKSYFDGCSTGGRQGLKEAQRFPEDYDAIVAGSPASNWSALMALSITIQNNLGPGRLGVDKLGLLKESAIKACDALDGVTDRVISDIGECRFDPADLQCKAGDSGQCLAPEEVAAANRIYAGVVDMRRNVVFPGTGPGSEPLWAAYASPQFGIGTNYFRNVVAKNPKWDPATFDPDKDLAAAERVDRGAAKAMNPNLSKFLDHGGKLITYHGTTDGLIPYGNSVSYYERVARRLGQERADEGVRFYLVPGMDHCSGGEGAFAIDWLTALEQWDDTGKPPGALSAAHPAAVPGPPGAPPPPPSTPFTRPACPYPLVATYKGKGDTAEAANFECVAPK